MDYYSLDILSKFISIFGIEYIKKLMCNKFIELLNCHYLPFLKNLNELGLPARRHNSIVPEINYETPEDKMKRMLYAFRNNIHFYVVSIYLLKLFPNQHELVEMTLINYKPDNMEYLNKALYYVYNDCM